MVRTLYCPLYIWLSLEQSILDVGRLGGRQGRLESSAGDKGGDDTRNSAAQICDGEKTAGRFGDDVLTSGRLGSTKSVARLRYNHRKMEQHLMAVRAHESKAAHKMYVRAGTMSLTTRCGSSSHFSGRLTTLREPLDVATTYQILRIVIHRRTRCPQKSNSIGQPMRQPPLTLSPLTQLSIYFRLPNSRNFQTRNQSHHRGIPRFHQL